MNEPWIMHPSVGLIPLATDDDKCPECGHPAHDGSTCYAELEDSDDEYDECLCET
jgi:hypothetical protein